MVIELAVSGILWWAVAISVFGAIFGLILAILIGIAK
jgi:ABC-type nitrate/sulfonate/bicarbonate transport system permease component